MRRLHFTILCLVVTLLALPGCGGSNTIWVTGHLLKGGAPYVPPSEQRVTLTFVAMEVKDATGKPVPATDPYLAEFDPANSSFQVPGPDRQGIPPGKYRVAVTQTLRREAFDAAQKKSKKRLDRDADTLADRFSATNSPIIVEVNRSEAVEIDLERPGK